MHLVVLDIASQVDRASRLVHDFTGCQLDARRHNEVFVDVIEDQVRPITGGHFVVDCVFGLVVEFDDATRLVEVLWRQ